MSNPSTTTTTTLQQSSPRKIFGFSLLFGFSLTSIALFSAVVDKYRFYASDMNSTAENKRAILTYIIVNGFAVGFTILTALFLVFLSSKPKLYIFMSLISLAFVVASVLITELYLSKKNITDPKLVNLIKIENYLLATAIGIILGMAAQSPNFKNL